MTKNKTYLISNEGNGHVLPDDGIYELTWILFAESRVIESGFDLTYPRIEVYKYISGTGATQTKSKVVSLDEGSWREWRFWIGQGFQRITDKDNKGWKYTEDIRERSGNKLVNKLTNTETSGMRRPRFAKVMNHNVMTQKKLAAESSETNERETA